MKRVASLLVSLILAFVLGRGQDGWWRSGLDSGASIDRGELPRVQLIDLVNRQSS